MKMVLMPVCRAQPAIEGTMPSRMPARGVRGGLERGDVVEDRRGGRLPGGAAGRERREDEPPELGPELPVIACLGQLDLLQVFLPPAHRGSGRLASWGSPGRSRPPWS